MGVEVTPIMHIVVVLAAGHPSHRRRSTTARLTKSVTGPLLTNFSFNLLFLYLLVAHLLGFNTYYEARNMERQ